MSYINHHSDNLSKEIQAKVRSELAKVGIDNDRKPECKKECGFEAECKKAKNVIFWPMTMIMTDSTGVPIPNTEFDVTFEFVDITTYVCDPLNPPNPVDANYILRIPLINFTTQGTGGFVATAGKPFPQKLRPTSQQTQEWTTGDAFLVSYPTSGFPSDLTVTTYKVLINTNGTIWISDQDGDAIPSKVPSTSTPSSTGHTINRQCKEYSPSGTFDATFNSIFTHTFQQQVLDGSAFPFTPYPTLVPVATPVSQHGQVIKLELPAFTFTTTSSVSPLHTSNTLNTGGFVNSFQAWLPEELRPDHQYVDSQEITTQVQSDSQLAPSASVTVTVNIMIDTYGRLWLWAADILGGTLPVGRYNVTAQTFYYLLPSCAYRKPENCVVQERFNDTTGFGGAPGTNTPLGNAYSRHLDDNFEDVIALCWASNSKQLNKTNNTEDLYIQISEPSERCIKPVCDTVNLTHNREGYQASNVGVAINRHDKRNLVVAYSNTNWNFVNGIASVPVTSGGSNYHTVPTVNIVDTTGTGAMITVILSSGTTGSVTQLAINSPGFNYTSPTITLIGGTPTTPAVLGTPVLGNPAGVTSFLSQRSKDGGQTWSAPGQIAPISTVKPSASYGPLSDAFGNFWWVVSTDALSPGTYKCIFYINTNRGKSDSWFTLPALQFAQGTNGPLSFTFGYLDNTCNKQYGLWFAHTLNQGSGTSATNQLAMSFIPINGPASFGTPQSMTVSQYSNQSGFPSIVTGCKGRVYLNNYMCAQNGFNFWASNIQQKAPGAFDASTVGPPQTITEAGTHSATTSLSDPSLSQGYPTEGYGTRNMFYVKKCGALCIILDERPDINVLQTFYTFMVVSFDNGITWSRRFPISSSFKNNRGWLCASYSEGEEVGSVVITWHDGRNSLDGKGTQFMATRICGEELFCILKTLAHEMGIKNCCENRCCEPDCKPKKRCCGCSGGCNQCSQ